MLKKSLKEKCGVIGVCTASNHAASLVRQGLAALQHRGQESTGISIITAENKIITYKNMGLVPHVLTSSILTKLGKSKLAIGHNRYATSGNSSLENAQPLMLKKGKFALSIGHNGNIPDITNLRHELGEKKRSISDTPLVAQLLLTRITKGDMKEMNRKRSVITSDEHRLLRIAKAEKALGKAIRMMIDAHFY